MRIRLALLGIAGTLFAQEPASNVSTQGWQAVKKSAVSRGLKPVTPTVLARLNPTPVTASRCSVPLLKMQIPPDVQFTMKTVEPPADKVDHMAAVMPAPSCPDPQ